MRIEFCRGRMRVVLTRKLADVIDGVDLRSREVGEAFDAAPDEARLLLAEQWAIVDRRTAPRPSHAPAQAGSAGPAATGKRYE